MIDIDAELLHPLRGIDDGRIDAERSPADQAVRQAAQPAGGSHAGDLRLQAAKHLIVGDVAEALGEGDPGLVERSGVGEHPHQSRVARVHVGEHHDRLRAELRGHACVLRPRPDREVEDHGVDAGRRHPPAVAYRDLVLPDHVVADDNLEAGGLEPPHELFAELAIHRLEG